MCVGRGFACQRGWSLVLRGWVALALTVSGDVQRFCRSGSGARIPATCSNPRPLLGSCIPLGSPQLTEEEAEMPDEVNIDELLELDADEARAAQLQGILKSCHNNTQAFVQELLLKLRGLQKQQVLQRRPSPELQERA
ncbi:protein phosphatase 1 regulatory subunit 14A isoform X2 [Terrapene carolina triunguis]|uniref:protein phosphatase 1 regulatory subunit 14A isoform X2 n=1 Tax=Terrapene triunguis TaxID=2587831 RepID=UPI000CEFBD29|nr:protein phosphatase 1 regulatory subunit 14A isoform X2 [Terrapene carolina triunguis]